MRQIIIALFSLVLVLVLAACKHPLEIVGEGDIVDLNGSNHGCTLEQFQAQAPACTENEAVGDYLVNYQPVPRAGWQFLRWDGPCGANSVAPNCLIESPAAWVELWDATYSDIAIPATVAVFEPEGTEPVTTEYWGSTFGVDDFEAYGTFLLADINSDGTFRYSTLLESSSGVYDSGLGYYRRESDGRMLVSATSSDYSSGGAATSNMDFIGLVDVDASDDEISVAYLTPTLTGASSGDIQGTYYCGTISTDPAANFARVQFDGLGGGTITVLQNSQGVTGQSGISYTVSSDGAIDLSYSGLRLVGSFLAGGDVIVGTQPQAFAQGAGICIRTSSGNSTAAMVGDYYGVYASTDPASALVELGVSANGSTSQFVLVDSQGGSNYAVPSQPMMVQSNGRVTVGSEEGMISADGRIAFTVNASGFNSPNVTVYVKQSQ